MAQDPASPHNPSCSGVHTQLLPTKTDFPASKAFDLSGPVQEVGKVEHEQVVQGGLPESQQTLLKSHSTEGLPVEDSRHNRASLYVQDAHPVPSWCNRNCHQMVSMEGECMADRQKHIGHFHLSSLEAGVHLQACASCLCPHCLFALLHVLSHGSRHVDVPVVWAETMVGAPVETGSCPIIEQR